MMLKKIGMTGWLALSVAFLLSYGYAEAAQPDTSNPLETAMIKLKYRSAADVKLLLEPLFEEESLQSGEQRIWIDERSNTIFIKSHENMALARDMIKKLDVLPPSIQIEIILLRASKSSKGPMFPGPTPKKLMEMGLKLKALFAFSRYELLDSISLITESGAEMLLNTGGKYKVTCTPRFIDEGKGIIRLGEFKLIKRGWKKNVLPEYRDKILGEKQTSSKLRDSLEMLAAVGQPDEPVWTTSLNIKNGDMVIIGGSKIDGNGTALITVVTARTVE